jgi:hypothetical protein
MSIHQAFRRQPVQPQMALRHQTTTLPAPIRGLIEIENWSFTKPGSAVILDNWFPTQRGLRLRGGCQQWTQLPDPVEPIISAFEYKHAGLERIFCATDTRLFDVTFAGSPTLIATVTDGNYSTSQMANQGGGDFLLAVNDAGDYPRRFDGTAWTYLNTDEITGPPGSAVEHGHGLTYVWKYRNRWFFIEGGSFNAWFLPLDAIEGALQMIPLLGAATRGGKLLFGASWTIDSGDGLDDKCVFVTDQGEVLIFTGSDPTGVVGDWHQEGRYDISRVLDKNAHQKVGGDLLIETISGIIPLSAAIQKDVSQLSLSAITRDVEPTWRSEVTKKSVYPWTMFSWHEENALFINFPGGVAGKRYTLVINLHTGAACRYVGWDTMAFMGMQKKMFFGTQDGKIMQAETSGYDNAHLDVDSHIVGEAYVATMVGGWEMFQVPPNQVTWLQARAAFFTNLSEQFEPQLSATVDYVFIIPPPPASAVELELTDVWDQGEWDVALWDAPSSQTGLQVRNTRWVSIGETGFSHAPICQVTVGQRVRPEVELISIAATFVRMAANV